MLAYGVADSARHGILTKALNDHPVSNYPRSHQCWHDPRLFAQALAVVRQSSQKLRETKPQVDPHRLNPMITGNAVSMANTERGWQVVVKEAGIGTVTRSFRERVAAFNFAESHVMRLGLDRITRL
ncbi:hypothetical protein EN828_17765 [Mesorhizobium sp. M2D.F.Ca.ET.185.01.1.1]|uniref:hypothetical protein n=2 Tax=Mesorhizobium TaxID=68287 RepID=UPI000FCBAEF3|nr:MULTISPECIES: hypothetical protein [unclassified Mesorhizobium]TGP50401.1 hypothetical protein EN873_24855 [bacterium M00.F.Ca.ET.230.01.1.1]TGP79286.1 hypothetical protein EN870_14085 [bacterium M00.F.Ca.ET.227.01.1.1]TGQ00976.1 hypothetical protein EN864_03150 [bacterium M00.F.Ca.ET.221.01.1.1]TGQ02505.1 hypothetical protein EN865_00755 [bacterium M00.F.Ca.ET.222.01.1.1]TGU34371.1 hypothetical protein EN799_20650 [bacterium M00.F.Ca.ET.156.01.1.1]TGU46334.1 hypothetical protein EN789_154